jgi:hypothetical protein
MKNILKLMGLLLLALFVLSACDNATTTDLRQFLNQSKGKQLIKYDVEQDGGTATSVDSTSLLFTFDSPVTGLTDTHITLTNDSGMVSQGTVVDQTDQDGFKWSIDLTEVIRGGEIKVQIKKAGIDGTVQSGIEVFKKYLDATATADGSTGVTPTSTITVTWVGGTVPLGISMDETNVTISPAASGTGAGDASVISFTRVDDSSWEIGIDDTDVTEGKVDIKIYCEGLIDCTIDDVDVFTD